ncbi:MAG: hypothetical protein K6A36_02225 [Paludibacteraceae bacterium]|nr:hypothetical protein [Paludibacteraceae bacterium]
MKKILYVALMAVLVAFTSCNQQSSDYYKVNKLKIDTEKHTVNGKKYDFEVEKCWKVTTIESIPSGQGSNNSQMQTRSTTKYSYIWGTEFDVVIECEQEMLATNEIALKAKYKYEEASDYDTYEKCDAAQQREGSMYKPHKD